MAADLDVSSMSNVYSESKLNRLNDTTAFNNTTFYQKSDVHFPIDYKDKVILPKKFSVISGRKPLNRSKFNQSLNVSSVVGATGRLGELYEEIESHSNLNDASNTHHTNHHDVDPFLSSGTGTTGNEMELGNEFEDYTNAQPRTSSPNDATSSKMNYEHMQSGHTNMHNNTLQPLLKAITNFKSNVSLAANYFFTTQKQLDNSFLNASESEKFPSGELVRDIKWHPHCRKLPNSTEINLQGLSEKASFGKPRVAIVFNNNTVEIQHCGDHVMHSLGSRRAGQSNVRTFSNLLPGPNNPNDMVSNDPVHDDHLQTEAANQVESPPSIILRHKLHEDLTACAWRPFYYSSLAVLSAKNGCLLWSKIGRQDVKSVATISSVSVRGKSEKVVPSSNANLIWSPPTWWKRDNSCNTGTNSISPSTNIEKQTSITFSPNGELLMILWFGTIFTVRICEFSQISAGFTSTPIAKFQNLCSPISYNFSKDTGLFSACTTKGQTIILDSNKPFSFFSNWNENLQLCTYQMPNGPENVVQNGCWWECSENLFSYSGSSSGLGSGTNSGIRSLNQSSKTVEGGFLYHYKNSTKIFVIQMFKAPMDTDKKFIDECKCALDLSEMFLSADTGYLEHAQENDTMVQARQDLVITALAWRDDICLIGHGLGHVSILKSRVNVGGMAFQYIRTLDLDDEIEGAIIDITIFDNRWIAVTSECGTFHYCRIESF